MRRNVLTSLVAGLALLAGSCGGQPVESVDPSTTGPVVSTTEPATPTTLPIVSTTTVDVQLIEKYLVEMSNLDGDLLDRLTRFEEDNQSFGDDSDDPSEEDMLRAWEVYWVGTYDLQLEHIDLLADVVAPSGFTEVHDDYVSAYQALTLHIKATIGEFSTLNEWDLFLKWLFGEVELPADFEVLNTDYVQSCRSLEQAGVEAGYELSLGCPEPPPEAVTIDVQVGGPWSASTNPLPSGDLVVDLALTNVGDETIRLAVVSIFEGDPTTLPVVNGIVDLRRSGITEIGFTAFGLVYPDDRDSENAPTPVAPELRPGETLTLTEFLSSNIIVIFDNRPGEYEAGNYIVIEQE